MKTNSKGIELIKSFEGLYLEAYKCPAGKWTIGWGHTGKVEGKSICKGMTITRVKAVELLYLDIESCEKTVSKYIKAPLTTNQLSALVSFIFNLGSGNLFISTLRKKLNKKDYAGAAAEFIKWNKAKVNGKKVVLNGLTRRRKAEYELFTTN